MSDVRIPSQWRHLLDDADHVDVKTAEGPFSVMQLAAGVLSYRPGWMAFLWRVRAWLVRVLGMDKQGAAMDYQFTADTLPAESGQKVGFFTVVDSDRETFWIVEGRESHLEAVLAFFAKPLPERPGEFHFQVVTVVRYRNRIGPVYFNIIRPFHHLVVLCSLRSVLAGADQENDQSGQALVGNQQYGHGSDKK